MRELSPLNDVVADDLLLDRIGSGGEGGTEPVAVLLGALATYAGAPLQPGRAGRRSRRHRFLSGLAVLAVGASGAGVAAAVTQPHLGGSVPDDALVVRAHAPAIHREPSQDRSGTSALTEVRLSALAFGGPSGPVGGSPDATHVVTPPRAPSASAAADPTSVTNLVVPGPAVPSTGAGSATGSPTDGQGAGSTAPAPQAPSGDGTVQGPTPTDPSTTAPGGDSATATAPPTSSSSPPSGTGDPTPEPTTSDTAPAATEEQPAPEPSPTTVGTGDAVAPGQGTAPTLPPGRASAPGQQKRQPQAGAQPEPGATVVRGGQGPTTGGPAVASRGGQLTEQTPSTSGRDAAAVDADTATVQAD
jgi:hypothetical protein